MHFVPTFCLRYFGTVSVGPNAGMELDGDLLESLCIGRRDLTFYEEEMLNGDVKNWIARAKKDAAENPGLRVQVCSRQYMHARLKKDRKMHYTVLHMF